ncbi:MAG: hypothetical protein ACJA1R_002279 [Flavobacteriales bacterium]|jgi:hypothetical protein
MRMTTPLRTIVLALALCFGSQAAAQDGFVFGDDEVDAVTIGAPVARFLQEGLDYYAAGRYEDASIYFWSVLEESDVAAEDLAPRARFELAKTLTQLELLQGALIQYDEIIASGSAHPYFEASAPWVLTIARDLPGDVDMLRRVAAFRDVFPDRIEPKYVDEFAFQLGQHFYNVGELDQALQYLGFVTDVSEYYPRALYLRAVTHVRQYEAQPAVDALIELMRIGESDKSEEVQRLAELARLSMARTFYSTGEYEKAADYYTSIPQSSVHWLDALFESSWAFFQLDRFNRSLGNLHSLNAPFFNDEYYPEAPILQAVIMFYNCRFADARAVLEEFDYTYGPLRDELEELLLQLETNADYYAFAEDADARLGRRFDPRLRLITSEALDDRSVTNSRAFIRELDRELERIEGADPGWARSSLGTFLLQETLAARELSIGQAGQIVRNRLTGLRDDLAAHQRSAEAILVEADLAEANALSPDLRAEMFRGREIVALPERHPEQMRWAFEGEYWRDELGYYFYQLDSVCQ